jgi:hypothetical protein
MKNGKIKDPIHITAQEVAKSTKKNTYSDVRWKVNSENYGISKPIMLHLWQLQRSTNQHLLMKKIQYT